MNFEQLHYFVQIYEHLSLNAVAKQLYISQPALTKSLQTMERELGVELFVRNKKGTYPTDAGKLFYKNAVQILSLYNDALLQINSELFFQKPLTIFVPPCIANTYFPSIMKGLIETFRNLKIHVQEYYIDRLPVLLNVPASFALTMGGSEIESFAQKNSSEYKYFVLKTEPCYAFVSKESSLSKEKKLSTDAIFDNNIAFHEFNKLHQYEKKYNDVNYITNFSISKEMIMSQNGVHILPIGIGRKIYSDPEIVSIPLERNIKVSYGVIVPKTLLESNFHLVIRYTIDLLKKCLNDSE